MFGTGSGASAGPVLVNITQGRTKSPDEWAKEITDKIMSVSDTAPQPIRDQALHFKSQVYVLVRDNIALMLQQEREWLNNQILRS